MNRTSRLPGTLADAWDWQLRGACRGRDSSQFFRPDDEPGPAHTHRESDAKALCATCPVRPECAAHALVTREPYGVGGGFSSRERMRLLAIGWEDLANSRRTRVDVAGLEARLRRRPRRPGGRRKSDSAEMNCRDLVFGAGSGLVHGVGGQEVRRHVGEVEGEEDLAR
jgi:WhiB family redox-sensing transcriptional regulator